MRLEAAASEHRWANLRHYVCVGISLLAHTYLNTYIHTHIPKYIHTHIRTRSDKVRELIAVTVLHTSLLNTTVVAFKVLPLGSYAPMPAPSPPFRTILEMVLWNGLQSCTLYYS